MVKLYDIYNNLLEEKTKGTISVSGIFSKLGINMQDYWQNREYKDLLVEEKTTQREIEISLPYRTSNKSGYIPLEVIKEYYEPVVYIKGVFELQKDVYHNIKIKTIIDVKEYVVHLDKLLCEIEKELETKIIVEKSNYAYLCGEIDNIQKRKKKVAKNLRAVGIKL